MDGVKNNQKISQSKVLEVKYNLKFYLCLFVYLFIYQVSIYYGLNIDIVKGHPPAAHKHYVVFPYSSMVKVTQRKVTWHWAKENSQYVTRITGVCLN